MIFGNADQFAIEAVIEPGPDYPAALGANVLGRIRLFVGGVSLGDFDEPACVIGTVRAHLAKAFAEGARQWHPTLLALSAKSRWHQLDAWLYGDDDVPASIAGAIADSPFLTHWSEAFDRTPKSFLVREERDTVDVLLERDGNVESHRVRIAEARRVAAEFAAWLRAHEPRLP